MGGTAVAGRYRQLFIKKWVESNIGDKDIEVAVGVIVSEGKPHPRPDHVDAELLVDPGKPHRFFGGVVSIDLQKVPIVCLPEIGVAIRVIVKEHDGQGLASGIADQIAFVVDELRVEPDGGAPCHRVGVLDRLAIKIRSLTSRPAVPPLRSLQ